MCPRNSFFHGAMALPIRALVLIGCSWLGGWVAYGLSLWLLYRESPFQHDVYIMGYWSLFYGLPFCLLVIVPSFLGLRAVFKSRLSGSMRALTACCLSFGYMTLLIGWPTIPETVLLHLFAAASSLIFGYGFSWMIAGKSARA